LQGATSLSLKVRTESSGESDDEFSWHRVTRNTVDSTHFMRSHDPTRPDPAPRLDCRRMLRRVGPSGHAHRRGRRGRAAVGPPSCWASPAGPCAQSPARWDGGIHALCGSQRTRPAEAAPGAAPATPINHGLRPPGHETFATAALRLFLPIEQSGIASGLSHDRQPEHFAPYGRRNSL
jgi:hypothetical protein